MAELKPQDKEHIRKMKKNDLIDLHFGLGQYIRNAFGLWQGNRALLESCGTDIEDDASCVIIEPLWQELHLG
jgi:hypothetical protein